MLYANPKAVFKEICGYCGQWKMATNKFLFSDATGEREKGGIYEDYMFKLLEKV